MLITLILGGTMVLSARYLAGKTTLADAGFRIIADLKNWKGVGTAVWAACGLGGVGYGIGQKRLRNKSERKKNLPDFAPQASV